MEALQNVLQPLESMMPSATERVAWPPWFEPGLLLVAAVNHLLPQRSQRITFLSLVAIPLALQMIRFDKGSCLDNYVGALTIVGVITRTLDTACSCEPTLEMWKKDKKGGSEKEEKPSGDKWPSRVFYRVLWAIDLLTSARFIGWNIQVKNVPEDANIGKSRFSWILRRLVLTAQFYLILDCITTARRTLAAPMYTVTDFWDLPLQYQILFGWLSGSQILFLLQMQYNMAAVVSCTLHICDPSDWPPLFGSFRPSEWWSTRRLWGTTWHQMMRRPCNYWGEFFADLTSAKKGTLRRRYTSLFFSFFYSCMIHNTGSFNLRSWEHVRYQTVFFLAQPFMIMVEDFACYLGSKCGLQQTRWTEYVGFFCSIMWFSYSLRYLAAAESYTAWDSERPLPFSFVEKALTTFQTAYA